MKTDLSIHKRDFGWVVNLESGKELAFDGIRKTVVQFADAISVHSRYLQDPTLRQGKYKVRHGFALNT